MDKLLWCDHSPWILLAVKRRVIEPERGRNYKMFYLRLQSSLKLSLRSHKRGKRLARTQSSWLQATCSQHNLVKTDALGRMYRYLKANLNSVNAEKYRFFCLTPLSHPVLREIKMSVIENYFMTHLLFENSYHVS